MKRSRKVSLRSRQAGVTLVELMMVIAVGATIVIAAMTAGFIAFRSSRVSDEASRLQTLSSKIQSAFSARYGNYSLVTNAWVLANMSIASSFTVSGTTISGAFAPITLSAGSDNGGANTSYEITYAGGKLSAADCLNLATSVASAFPVIVIGGQTVQSSAVGALATNMTAAANACKLAGNTVVFASWITI